MTRDRLLNSDRSARRPFAVANRKQNVRWAERTPDVQNVRWAERTPDVRWAERTPVFFPLFLSY